MTVQMKIEGLEETLKAFDRLGDFGKKEGEKATRASLEMVRSTAIKSIQRGPKTGEVYERGSGQNLSTSHRASAPGEAPATDTGRLVSSIKVIHKGLAGKVESKLNYSFWLEFGTLQMKARPFLRPALKENTQKIVDQFSKALDKAVRAFNGR